MKRADVGGDVKEDERQQAQHDDYRRATLALAGEFGEFHLGKSRLATEMKVNKGWTRAGFLERGFNSSSQRHALIFWRGSGDIVEALTLANRHVHGPSPMRR